MVKGRVVTADGKPVVGVNVNIQYENLFIDSNGQSKPIKGLDWASSGFPETDQDGYFMAKIPHGKTYLNVFLSGYYSEPESLEVSFDGQETLPNYVVIPMPTVKGVVVDAQQQPIKNTVVRLHTTRKTDYVLSDEDGKFSVKADFFNYDREKKKRKFDGTLTAFDPHSNRAAVATVDLSDPKIFEKVRLELVPREANWLANVVHKKTDPLQFLTKEQTKLAEERMKKQCKKSTRKARQENSRQSWPEELGSTPKPDR